MVREPKGEVCALTVTTLRCQLERCGQAANRVDIVATYCELRRSIRRAKRLCEAALSACSTAQQCYDRLDHGLAEQASQLGIDHQ